MVRPMKASDVTLSENARRLCQRLGVPEGDVRAARAGSTSTTTRPDVLLCWGDLPDGRPARMTCSLDMPHYIISWRPLQRD